MFHYTGKKIAGFLIAQSIQYQGDESTWTSSSTEMAWDPRILRTVNVFAEGVILYTLGDYSRLMNAGETAFDQTMEVLPASTEVTFKVMSPYAIKYCTTPILDTDNCTRDVYEMQPGDTHSEPTDTCIFVLSGEINYCNLAMKSISYRLLPANEVITATVASKVLVNRIAV